MNKPPHRKEVFHGFSIQLGWVYYSRVYIIWTGTLQSILSMDVQFLSRALALAARRLLRQPLRPYSATPWSHSARKKRVRPSHELLIPGICVSSCRFWNARNDQTISNPML